MVGQRRLGTRNGRLRRGAGRAPALLWQWAPRTPILALLLSGLIPGQASALAATTPSAGPAAALAADPPAICDWAAAEASRRSGVPISVLKAISLNETGRKRGGVFRPWPWTVNMEGKGLWFDSAEAALAYAEKEHGRGARSFDSRVLPDKFQVARRGFRLDRRDVRPAEERALCRAFSQPASRRDRLVERGGRRLSLAEPGIRPALSARFERFRTGLLHEDGRDIPDIPDIVLASNGGLPSPVAAVDRINRFPLLQRGSGAALSSLVPIGNGGGASLFGPGTSDLAPFGGDVN